MRIDAPYIIRIDSLQNTMTWFYFLLNLEQVKVFDSDTTSDDCLGERDVDLDLQVVLSICFRWCVCAGGFIAPGFAELMDLRYLYVAHSHLLRDRVSNSLSHTHCHTQDMSGVAEGKEPVAFDLVKDGKVFFILCLFLLSCYSCYWVFLYIYKNYIDKYIHTYVCANTYAYSHTFTY